MNKNDVKTKYNFIKDEFLFSEFMEVWMQRIPCKVNMTPTSMNLRKMKFTSKCLSK